MKTLATQSASGTFTGDRSTLNNEYQGLLTEITRQATNINLNAGGTSNTNLSVYIGGAKTTSAAGVNINLSGASNAVDATSLKLNASSVIGGGNSFSNPASSSLNDPNAAFLKAGTETFSLTYVQSDGTVGTASSIAISAPSGGAGLSGTQFVQQLNQAIQNAGVTGITAQISGSGKLQLSGSNLLNASVTNSASVTAGVVGSASSTETLTNTANYQTGDTAGTFTGFADGTGATTAHSQDLTISVGGQSYSVSLNGTSTDSLHYADTVGHAVTALNKQLSGSGVYATTNQAGTGIVFQSSKAFTVSQSAFTAGNGTGAAGSVFGGTANTVGSSVAVTAPSQDSTSVGNANAAIDSINAAIKALGQVQGTVGAGENKLQYSITLAQSQISNYSAAQSQIRDADVASDAASLTKSQVLVQTSIAAMAQANSEPQSVLKLLQG